MEWGKRTQRPVCDRQEHKGRKAAVLLAGVMGGLLLIGPVIPVCAVEPGKMQLTGQNAAAAPPEGIQTDLQAGTDGDVTAVPGTEWMYATASVNVRTVPSQQGGLLGTLSAGQQILTLGREANGWYAVAYGDGGGYVSGKYLRILEGQAEQTAVPGAAEGQAEQTAVPGAAEGQAEQTAAQGTAEGQPQQQTAAPGVAAGRPEQTAMPTGQSAQGSADQTVSADGSVPVAQVSARIPTAEGIYPGVPIVFIGDSRFVQMREAVGGNPWVWIAESGKGYDWFVEKGLDRADNVIGTGTRVIINLGVNDVRNADRYISLFNQKAAEWTMRGAVVYYSSVNPVWTNLYVTKEQVEAFNQKLQASLAPYIYWIDSYSYLQSTGCRIVDGLHYDTPTYMNLYAYYMALCS